MIEMDSVILQFDHYIGIGARLVLCPILLLTGLEPVVLSVALLASQWVIWLIAGAVSDVIFCTILSLFIFVRLPVYVVAVKFVTGKLARVVFALPMVVGQLISGDGFEFVIARILFALALYALDAPKPVRRRARSLAMS